MVAKKPNELMLPPAVETDPKALELVRVWAAHGQQHVSISAEVWDDPGNWGIMLVDLARHLANYYSQHRGMRREEVLSRIKTLFEAEWATPTSEATGDLVE